MPINIEQEMFDLKKIGRSGFEIDDLEGGNLDDFYEKHIGKKK